MLFLLNLTLKQEGSCKATWREPAAEGPAIVLVGKQCRLWLVGGGRRGGWNLLELILGSFCCKPQIIRPLSQRCPTFGPTVKMFSPLWKSFLFFLSLKRFSNLLKHFSLPSVQDRFFFQGQDLALEYLKRGIFCAGMGSLIELFLLLALPSLSLDM